MEAFTWDIHFNNHLTYHTFFLYLLLFTFVIFWCASITESSSWRTLNSMFCFLNSNEFFCSALKNHVISSKLRRNYNSQFVFLLHRFAEKTLTNGWGGHALPSGSFYDESNHYIWVRFTTNGGNGDGRFHKGWSGKYQKYYPYVNKKKRRK